MRIKPGVNININPVMMIALVIVNEVYQKHMVELVVTSGNDSVHSKHSHHYKGLAVDIRTNNIPNANEIPVIAKEIQDALGSQFQVIEESNHIHIEFDPES